MHKGKRKGLRAKAGQRKEQKIRRKGKTNERNTRKKAADRDVFYVATQAAGATNPQKEVKIECQL